MYESRLSYFNNMARMNYCKPPSVYQHGGPSRPRQNCHSCIFETKENSNLRICIQYLGHHSKITCQKSANRWGTVSGRSSNFTENHFSALLSIWFTCIETVWKLKSSLEYKKSSAVIAMSNFTSVVLFMKAVSILSILVLKNHWKRSLSWQSL